MFSLLHGPTKIIMLIIFLAIIGVLVPRYAIAEI